VTSSCIASGAGRGLAIVATNCRHPVDVGYRSDTSEPEWFVAALVLVELPRSRQFTLLEVIRLNPETGEESTN